MLCVHSKFQGVEAEGAVYRIRVDFCSHCSSSWDTSPAFHIPQNLVQTPIPSKQLLLL